MAKSVVNVDIDLNTAPIEQLEAELEQVNEQLKGMERGTKEFESMAAESAKLTNALNKANSAAEGFTDEKKFQAADGAIKVLGGSLASVVGVLGTLGIESEAFGDLEKKAASAIAVAIGVKDLSEGFKQLRESTVLATAATKIFGNTTRLAIIATGVGAFVVLVGTLVAYWDDVTKAVKNFANSVPFVGKAIDAIKGAFDSLFNAARPVLEFLGILPDEAERAAIALEDQTNKNINNLRRSISIAQAEGAEAKKMFELRKALIEEEIKLLQDKEDKQQELFDKTTELLTLEAEERKRIADEQVDNIERVSVATVNALEAKSVAMLETAPIEADLLDLTTAAEIRSRQATEAKSKADEAQIALDQQRVMLAGAVSQALGGLSNTLGQATAAGKAAAVASIAIETGIGFANALRIAQETAKGTGPAAAFAFPIFYATQIAAVLNAIGQAKAILSGVQGGPAVPVAVQGGNVGQPGGSSRGSITPPQGQTTAAPQVQTVQPTVQAYVISGDVTSGQEADARLSKRRSLG